MALVTFYNNLQEAAKSPVLISEASWILNKPGRLVFSLPIDHSLAKYQYLKWGTVVTAQFDGFKDLWVGFVEPPRSWGNGRITVNCRSMEYIMKYRRQLGVGDNGIVSTDVVLHGTAGSLVEQILQIANSIQHTGISLGSVYQGGIDRQETVNDLLDSHLRNVARRSGCVWNITGVNINGKLELKLNLFRESVTTTDYLLEEGVNLETPQTDSYLYEDGDVYTDVLGLGDASVAEQVMAYRATDDAAIGTFGLRQTIQVFDGNVEAETVKANALQFLVDHKDAVASINPVLPYTPEIAAKLSLGTLMPIRLHSVGFKPDGTLGYDGYTPINMISINESTKKISLVVGVENE